MRLRYCTREQYKRVKSLTEVNESDRGHALIKERSLMLLNILDLRRVGRCEGEIHLTMPVPNYRYADSSKERFVFSNVPAQFEHLRILRLSTA